MRSLAACAVTAGVLGILALALDHGAELGLGRDALEAVGRAYFALLLGAPLAVYPFAWGDGRGPRARIALSLLPGFLWWLTEVGLRLAGHGLPEALWLACSPLNLAHLYLSLLAVAIADLLCRVVARRSRGGLGLQIRAAAAVAVALVAGPVLVLAWFPPFLHGYHLLFQRGLLPMPASLPGPLQGSAIRPGEPAQRAPNVVFILSDDHRYDFAGYEGHPFLETPALDRLAAEGLRFSRAYVTSSLCSPSRASFLTGLYPQRHGVWNNFTPWSDDNRTFLEYLSQAGYATAFVGKWHMPGRLPELRGVDHFVTFTHLQGQGVYEWCPLVVDGREEPSRTRYITTELTDRAIAWLDAHRARGGGPFALVLSHKSVHADFTPDESDRGRYARAAVPLPAGAHPWTAMTDAQYVHLNLRPLGESVRRYAEAVASMDREIDRVLAYLSEHGLEEHTVVVYTSDNGYLWGEHARVDKRWPLEPSIRVPLLLRYPAAALPAGASVPALVANVDVAPTLLDLAGLAVPGHMQGRSLRPLLEDPGAEVRDALLYTYYFEPPYPVPTSRAVVTRRHKYVEASGRPPELFDLEADPGETRNRLAQEPGLARALAAKLASLAREVR